MPHKRPESSRLPSSFAIPTSNIILLNCPQSALSQCFTVTQRLQRLQLNSATPSQPGLSGMTHVDRLKASWSNSYDPGMSSCGSPTSENIKPLVECCCFTSTETIWLIRDGGWGNENSCVLHPLPSSLPTLQQDVGWVLLYVHRNRRLNY